MRTLPDGELTLLFTDVDGSTRLLHELGERYRALLEQHRLILRRAFTAHGGVEVDTQGDAFFVVFEDPAQAVAAAMEAQRDLAAGTIRVRMGLLTGTPQRTSEGYVGMDVHRAARIAAAGHGGQVLLSRSTADAVGHAIQLRDLGEHRLKDLAAAEWIFQVSGSGVVSDFPPLRSLNNSNLPAPGRKLVGRRRELEEVCAVIRAGDARVVTLTGTGGTGKTRLAVAAGLDLLDDFPNGVMFVGLAAITDAELVPQAIAHTLGVREAPGEPLLETLSRHLEMRRLLLVLDNFEHVVESAPDVAALVSRAPGLAVLATSREPLRIEAEREFPVGPLQPADAVDLFTDRARLIASDFQPDAATEEICGRVDGLPLAIELAAARVRLMPPGMMLERMERPMLVLRSSGRDVPERQRTLEATINWSYGLLSPEEQALFRDLAVFRGGCSLEAAEQVCSADPDVLEALVQKNLVFQRPDSEGLARFWMLATVRAFAEQQLGDSTAELRHRHATWVCDLAETAELHLLGAEQVRWLARLQREMDNIRGAVNASLAAGDAETALRITAALVDFWDAQGSYQQAGRWLDQGLAGYAGDDDGVRARAFLAAGLAAFQGADLDRARSLTEQSIAASGSLDDAHVRSRALSQLAAVAMVSGDFPRTVTLAEQAVAEAADDNTMRAFGLNVLAVGRYELGERQAARQAFSEALQLLRSAGDRRDVAILEGNLGGVALLEGDYPAARRRFETAIALSEELGDHGRLPAHHQGMASAALIEGSLDVAAEHVSAALIGSGEVGDTATLIAALTIAAGVLAGRGDPAEAAVLRGAVAQSADERGMQVSGADVLVDEQLLEPAAQSMGAQNWADSLSEGRGLALPVAVDRAQAALARAGRGIATRNPAG